MSDLVTRAQLVLLAQALHVPVERVQHLERLGADNLHALRERISHKLFDGHAEIFRRVNVLAPLVPLKIAVPIVSRMVPPLVGGRAAGAIGLVHPKKAVTAITMLPTPYMADAAPYIDPRAFEKLAHLVPPEPVVAVANELLRRREYITAGILIDFATPELLHAVEQGVDDDEGLLRIGTYMHSGKSLSRLFRMILEVTPHRIPRMTAAVVNGPTDLRLAALSAVLRYDDDLITVAGDILFDETEGRLLADLVHTYVGEDVTTELLTFAGHLSPAALDMLAANSVFSDQTVLEAFVSAASQHPEPGVWRGLLDIVERMTAGRQRTVVVLLLELDGETLAGLARIATRQHLWPMLLHIVAGQDADVQARLADRWRALDAADRDVLERHIRDLGLEDALKPMRKELASA